MPRIIPLVVVALVMCLADQIFTGQSFAQQAFAQLTPPAGSAGAGAAPISGIPFGPANPRALADPSGIGNALSTPPLRSNIPAIAIPQTTIAPLSAAPPASYPFASEPVLNADAIEPRPKKSPAHKGHHEVSSFTGICRGC